MREKLQKILGVQLNTLDHMQIHPWLRPATIHSGSAKKLGTAGIVSRVVPRVMDRIVLCICLSCNNYMILLRPLLS
jgi:hypothetical protein